MRQFYLINDNLSEQKLAEEYLEDEYNLNPNIQESVLRIINFLSNVTLDSSGNIEQLKPEVKEGIIIGYSFKDEYKVPNSNRYIKYEIVKKLMSQNHVYEIRFLSETNEGVRKSKVYFVWTYGFTKFPTKDQRKIRKMNLLTDQLGKLAELIHNQLVNNREKNFIGRRNERHEVQ